jgi:hypothetical protein
MLKLSLLAFLGAALFAAAHADPPTLLAQRGKLLVSEDLAAMPAEVSKSGGLNDLQSGWKFRPGQWDFIDGALRGSQLEADHHSAAAFFAYPWKDAVLQFEVKLDGARQVHFCVDDPPAMRDPTPTRAAEKRVEHLCRVTITPDGFFTQKDDHDHDGPDVAVPFGSVKMSFPPGEWHTVLVEIKGDEMVASVDGHSIAGAHPQVASPKAYFSFGVTGTSNGFNKVPPLSASFRHLRIWEALPNSDWPKTKQSWAAAEKPAIGFVK